MYISVRACACVKKDKEI